MRLIACLLLLLTGLTSLGNMASPYQRGTLTASAISSKDIDVVSEQIVIRISPNGDSAYYNVTYTVRTDTSGKQIPLLFVAKNYAGKFSVTVNGQSIAISNALSLTKLSAYSALKEESNAAGTSYTIELQWDSTDRRTYPLSDLIYFEVDLSKGVHEIKVEYTATASYDGSGWVKQYFHRYSLSPAKYWRTFGRLDVTLVTNPVNGTTTTNLGIPAKGSLKNKAEWIFTSLPAGWIEVQYEPIISSTAQMLIKVTPEGIACIALLILFFIHLYLLHRCRKQTLQWTFTSVLISGGVAIPFLLLLIHFLSYGLIDWTIGPAAAGYHGYVGLIFLLYPVLVPVYLAASWLTEKTLSVLAARLF